VRFSDSKFLLSPYRVLHQETVYLYQRADILDFTEAPEATKESRGVRYGSLHNTAPFSFDLVYLQLKMPQPLLILSEASKTVHVSHWGFVSVDEFFALENIGA